MLLGKDFQCFGPSAEQQKKSGRTMIIIGAIVLLLEVIVRIGRPYEW